MECDRFPHGWFWHDALGYVVVTVELHRFLSFHVKFYHTPFQPHLLTYTLCRCLKFSLFVAPSCHNMFLPPPVYQIPPNKGAIARGWPSIFYWSCLVKICECFNLSVGVFPEKSPYLESFLGIAKFDSQTSNASHVDYACVGLQHSQQSQYLALCEINKLVYQPISSILSCPRVYLHCPGQLVS